ncbi:MAG: D-alanyl-D-alanine carboxypeptidase family protein [Patescibacteria group bacterium]
MEKSYKKYFLLIIISLGIAGALGYLGYQNHKLKQEKTVLEKEFSKTKQEFASTSENLLGNIDAIKQILATTQDERNNLEQDLLQKQEAMDSIGVQVQAMAGTVGALQKLSGTDRELLKKYSRIYFLNENYIPKNLISIPMSYLYEPEKEKLISSEIWPFLEKLLDDANVAQIDIKIISTYRSFGAQSTLKSAYKITYGYGANKFSADQGYSEHQLGTAIDFTTSKLGANFIAFEKTGSYAWLTENAYKYGFILSYPKKNTYYVFEPWHWRFVGKSLALKLYNENKNFYDITQREIDEYLISIFDQ